MVSVKGFSQRTQGLSRTPGRAGTLRDRGKHSLPPSGEDSADPGSDLSPDHSLCVSDWSVNWRHMDAVWFYWQWGRGAGSLRYRHGCLSLLHPGVSEQFSKGEHDTTAV